VKNKTETGHKLYVTSSPVMHLVFITHETVTTQRGATNTGLFKMIVGVLTTCHTQ